MYENMCTCGLKARMHHACGFGPASEVGSYLLLHLDDRGIISRNGRCCDRDFLHCCFLKRRTRTISYSAFHGTGTKGGMCKPLRSEVCAFNVKSRTDRRTVSMMSHQSAVWYVALNTPIHNPSSDIFTRIKGSSIGMS